jgi:NAD(P)H dehydrogenase (quinone)
MIVVTGAHGRLGGAVITELLKTLPPSQVGVSTTRPGELSKWAAMGVRIREGSYDDPTSLRRAFEGADRLLLVSAPRHGNAATEAHQAGIEAARDAGVGRLFYTSHVGADALSPFPPAVTHAATEVMLRESGIPFTALRNGFYADTPLRMIHAAADSGVLRVPVDAPVSWTMHRDLAPALPPCSWISPSPSRRSTSPPARPSTWPTSLPRQRGSSGAPSLTNRSATPISPHNSPPREPPRSVSP